MSETTLHSRILADIEGRIVSGEWPPGYRLPFEVDLAAQFGCSRMTVNKVLAQMVRAGLVERKKRAGTFVSLPKAQTAILDIHDIRDEVRSLNIAYGYALLSSARRVSNRSDMIRLELTEPADVLDLTSLHSGGDEPFCLEERLIHLGTVPEALEFAFDDVAPGAFLMAQVPWTAAQHRIQAVPAGKKEAECLELDPKQACLVIERRTWCRSGPVTHVRLTYPGNRHLLTANFKPNSV